MRRFISTKFTQSSILIKFFLSLLFIGSISLIILSLVIFYWFKGKSYEDINRLERSSLLNIEASFHNYIDLGQNYVMQLYQNPITKSVLLFPNEAFSEETFFASNQLSSIISANDFINSIYFFNKDGVSFNVTKEPETTAAQEKLFRIMKIDTIRSNPIIWNLDLMAKGTYPAMTIIFNQNLYTPGGFDGGVALNINLENLRNKIFPNAAEDQKKVFIISHDGKIIIQENNNQTYVKQIEGSIFQRMKASNKSYDAFLDKIGNENMMICYTESEDGKFYVLSILEYSQSMIELTNARNTLVIICVAIILIVLILSLFVSYWLYKPLGFIFRNIRNLFSDPNQKSINENEVKLASNTLAHIAKTLNSLEKANEMHEIIKILNSPEKDGEKELGDLMLKINAMTGEHDVFCIIVMRIKNYKTLSKENNADAMALQLNSICVITMDYFSRIAHCSPFQTGSDTVCFMIRELDHENRMNESAISAILMKIQDVVIKSFEMQIAYGISNFGKDVYKIKEMYSEAAECVKYGFIAEKENIFYAESVSQLENSRISDNYIDPVINAVKKTDENEYKHSLKNLIDVCHKYRYEVIIKTFTNLSISIIKLNHNSPLDTDPVLNLNYYEVYKRIMEIGNLNELYQWFSELYLKVSTVLKDINSRRIQDLMGSVMNYIHEKYLEADLSVNTIMDKFDISSSYFSRIFNEFTGNSFPDYINNLRLEKAKEILSRNTEKEISEIGYSVGYRSNTYFASSFKKRYGITPSEFRKSNLSSF